MHQRQVIQIASYLNPFWGIDERAQFIIGVGFARGSTSIQPAWIKVNGSAVKLQFSTFNRADNFCTKFAAKVYGNRIGICILLFINTQD